jgi:hypothetical protein
MTLTREKKSTVVRAVRVINQNTRADTAKPEQDWQLICILMRMPPRVADIFSPDASSGGTGLLNLWGTKSRV